MLKTRIAIVISISLVILGVALFTFRIHRQEPAQNLEGTVRADCAPWDGEAFTITVPFHDGDMISISIWKSPQAMTARASFSFPDNTGQVGNASLIPPTGLPEMLSGRVFLQQMNQSDQVVGSFDLMTESGEQCKAAFTAEWTPGIALCG